MRKSGIQIWPSPDVMEKMGAKDLAASFEPWVHGIVTNAWLDSHQGCKDEQAKPNQLAGLGSQLGWKAQGPPTEVSWSPSPFLILSAEVQPWRRMPCARSQA